MNLLLTPAYPTKIMANAMASILLCGVFNVGVVFSSMFPASKKISQFSNISRTLDEPQTFRRIFVKELLSRKPNFEYLRRISTKSKRTRAMCSIILPTGVLESIER